MYSVHPGSQSLMCRSHPCSFCLYLAISLGWNLITFSKFSNVTSRNTRNNLCIQCCGKCKNMCVLFFFCLVHICILLSFVGSFLSWGHFGRNNWSRSLFLTRLVPLFPQRTDCSGTIVHVTLDWELTYGSHRDFHFIVETSSRNILSPKFTFRRGSKFCVLGQMQLRNDGDTSIIPPSRKLC